MSFDGVHHDDPVGPRRHGIFGFLDGSDIAQLFVDGIRDFGLRRFDHASA
jgi:hypothetical protein